MKYSFSLIAILIISVQAIASTFKLRANVSVCRPTSIEGIEAKYFRSLELYTPCLHCSNLSTPLNALTVLLNIDGQRENWKFPFEVGNYSQDRSGNLTFNWSEHQMSMNCKGTKVLKNGREEFLCDISVSIPKGSKIPTTSSQILFKDIYCSNPYAPEEGIRRGVF